MSTFLSGVLMVCLVMSCVESEQHTTLSGEFVQVEDSSCDADPTKEWCMASNNYSGAFKNLEDIAAILHTIDEIASSPNVGATDIVDYLNRTTDNLRTGKIRGAVMGLTDSGRVTTLNALLGNKFLPANLRSHITKQIKIRHRPEQSQDELYAKKEKDVVPALVETGREEILKHLTKLNTEVKDNQFANQEMIVHAPFTFLQGVDRVDFELSYSPYLFDTSIRSADVSLECKLSLMEKCAYVFIFNLQLIQGVSESQVLRLIANVTTRRLTEHIKSQELGKAPNVNRLLILVNALDIVYFDDSPNSLKAENISDYVSNYLANSKMLGVWIPPERVIPYSAKWGLVSRIWSNNPKFLDPNSESDYEWYKESLLLLRRAGYEERVTPLIKAEITEENVRTVSSLLLEMSQIETIEKKLKEMFHENRAEILREAAVYNNIAVLQSLETKILRKAEEENVERKQELLSKHNELYDNVIQTKEQQIQSLQRIPGAVVDDIVRHIGLTVDSLQKSTDGQIGIILMEDLHEFLNKDTQEEVVKRLLKVKRKVAELALEEQRKMWTSVSRIVTSSQEQLLTHGLVQLKLQVTRAFKVDVTSDSHFSSYRELIASLAIEFIESLDKLDPSTLLADFPLYDQEEINMSFIPDDKLSEYVLKVSRTKWFTEYRTKKKKTGFLGLNRKRVKWSESVPHEVTLYSPDVPGLKSTLTTEGSSQWAQSFHQRVDEVVAQTSQELVDKATQAVTNVFSQTEKRIEQTLDDMRDAEQTSIAIVEDLNQRHRELLEAKTKLLSLHY